MKGIAKMDKYPKNREQIYKEVFDKRFFELLVINRLPRTYCTRKANIYAVKNTEKEYQKQKENNGNN